MQELQDRIQHAGNDLVHGILRVDAFLNHQVDTELMFDIGREFARQLESTRPTKILTVETGGIVPAFATAAAFHVPLLVARKRRAAGMMHDLLQESTLSQTHAHMIDLFVSPEFLSPTDRIVIIDDFLTNAQIMLALTRLAIRGGAQVVGIGVVIEKTFEGGRNDLASLNVPVIALARISKIVPSGIEFLPQPLQNSVRGQP